MIKGIWGRGIISAILISAIAVGLVACGGGGSSTIAQAELEKAEKHGREAAQEKAKEGVLERKLEKLERENTEAKKRRKKKAHKEQKKREEGHDAPPPAESSPAPSSTPSGTDCGDGVIAGPETSCGFALETRAEYERVIGAGSGTVEPYSESNEKFYSMYCTEGTEHECSGAISATVYWP